MLFLTDKSVVLFVGKGVGWRRLAGFQRRKGGGGLEH